MIQPSPTLGHVFEITFLLLQAMVVAFLLFQDWVNLGRLAAIHMHDTLQRRVFGTCRARYGSVGQ